MTAADGDLSLDSPHGPLPVHVAAPSAPGPWPAVLVIHDAVGMTADLRRQAQWLAGQGFLAAAPDLYRGGPLMRCLFHTFRDAARGSGRAFDDLETVRGWLAGHPEGNGRVGVIGFCMGGGFALMLAPTGGFGAASANYGVVPKDAMEAFSGACPIVGSYGGRDPSLRGAAPRLQTALTAAGVEHDIKEYPQAGHGFLNDHDDSDVPWQFLLLGRATRTAYDEPAATDARRRISRFLHAHLD